MSKEINKYLNLSIVMSVLFAILGVILVVSPNSSLDTIAYLLAAFLLVYGTYNFIDSFAIHPIFFFMKMASSVISILLGIIIFLNPEIYKNIIPLIKIKNEPVNAAYDNTFFLFESFSFNSIILLYPSWAK